jgi:hypothetical protein
MFSSVHRCTGDLTCEVLILTCFGNLPPDRQVYLGMGTMIVKETIRGEGKRIGVSASGRLGKRIGVSASGRIGVRGDVSALGVWAYAAARAGGRLRLRRPADPPLRRPAPRPPRIFGW